MRRPAIAVCVALALSGSGCAAREARTPSARAMRAAAPAPADTPAAAGATTGAADEPMYAATSAGSATSRGPATFGNFVRAHEPQLQFCYREARAASPRLTGSATVAVTLAADGTVVNADVVRRSWSHKGADVVERCMLSRVRAWKFPPLELEGAQKQQTHSFAVIFSS